MIYMKKLIKRGSKRRKGFTLIELLAVILILGIIALIAVPTVNSVINESRQDAKEDSGTNLVTSTNNFCVSSKINNDKPYSNVLSYESDEYPTVESLIGVKGDVPNYDDFLQYELTNSCEVKVIYETDGYRCSNQLDSDGIVTYIASLANITADKVTCEKTDTSIFVNQTVNLPTDGVKHVLKSYYDSANDDALSIDFRSDTYRTTIYEIEFTNHTNVPESVSDDMKWDVSEAQDGSIIAWITPLATGSKWNKLYIGSTGSIYANPNSSGLFSKMDNVTKITFGNFNTSDVTDISGMFAYDYNLNDLDVSNFDVSKVTDFSYMFFDDMALPSIDITNFKSAKPVNLSHMFGGDYYHVMALEEIKGVGKLNTSKVTDMSYMFAWDENLKSLDVSKWDTSNVTNMGCMFLGLNGITSFDLSNFDTSNVTNMLALFAFNDNLVSVNISSFDTSKVINMNQLFYKCPSLKSVDLSNFDTSNVTMMIAMFYDDISLTSLDVSNFDTSNVTDMSWMFAYDSGLTSLDLSNFDTSKVTDMSGMFAAATGLTNLDLSNFDTSNVTDMYAMFYGDISSKNGKIIGYMNLTEIKGIENFNTSKVTDMEVMFSGNSGLKSLDLSKWNVSNVKSLAGMFYSNPGLVTLNISNWNTKNVTDMSWMFAGCYFKSDGASMVSALREIIGLGDLDTSNVTDMGRIFYRGGPATLDLSGWDTSKVTKMGYMFRTYSNLRTVYVKDKFSVASVTDDETMFLNVKNLVGAISYNENKLTKEYANYTTGYFTYKED